MANSCAVLRQTETVEFEKLIAHTFTSVDSLLHIEKRPLAIFIHTDWCSYCANMKETTLKNSKVIDILNSSYYFISFDAESKEDINFGGRVYRYVPSGRNTGTHELARELGEQNGHMGYPSFVVTNVRYELTYRYNTFLTGEEMMMILAGKME